MFFNNASLLIASCLAFGIQLNGLSNPFAGDSPISTAKTYCEKLCQDTKPQYFGHYSGLVSKKNIRSDGVQATQNGKGPISCKCKAKLTKVVMETTKTATESLKAAFKFKCLEWNIEHKLAEQNPPAQPGQPAQTPASNVVYQNAMLGCAA